MCEANIVQSILQFLEESGFKESKLYLESESATFLDIDYVKILIRGAWEDLQKYLSSFPETRKIVCVILKHKYLEAINRADYNATAVILSKEMDKSDYGDGLFSELTMLLTIDSLRYSYGTRLREKKSKTGLMFDRDQSKMVVVHQSQLTMYDASSNCINKWVPEKLCVQIEDAAFCGGYNIYALLIDGRVCVLSYPGLILLCVINMTAYVDESIRPAPYPKAIAAHPVEVDRIAVGLTNGDVFVLEPRGWGSTRVAEVAVVRILDWGRS